MVLHVIAFVPIIPAGRTAVTPALSRPSDAPGGTVSG